VCVGSGDFFGIADMAGPFGYWLAFIGLAMVQFVAGRPAVDELRAPLYKVS
jgi:hypothetical protein